MSFDFSLDLKISGFKEGADALQQFSNDVLEGTRFALEDIGSMLVDEMQSTCPVDTGFLRDNIHAEMDGDDLNVSSDAPYSGVIEYGSWKQEPQPFFEPAINKVRNGFGLEEIGRDAIDNWERLASQVPRF